MKIQNQILKLVLTVVLALSIFSCDKEGNNDEIVKLPTINEIVNADLANYSVLRKGLEVSGLLNVITSNGAYTVFAPNNASFAAYKSINFPTGISEAIITSTTPAVTQLQKDELKRLLMYHVVSGAVFSSDLPSKNYFKTISPYGISTTGTATLSAYVDKTNGIEINGGDLMVGTPAVSNGGAKVTEGDIKASNGVIHKINSVLALPTLINQLNANPDLSNFLTNLSADDASARTLVSSAVAPTVQVPSQVGPPAVTANNQLFVPVNKAFDNAATYLTGKTPAQISSIFKYHITTGSKYDRNANVGLQLGQFQNDGAATTTSYLPTTAITNATVTSKTAALLPATGNQTFLIQKNSFNIIKLDPVVPATTPATFTESVISKLKTTNIHTSNGIIHTIDTVLQPAL